MRWRSAAAILAGMVFAAAALLWLFERQLSSAWFRLGMQPEVITALERSLEDRKTLARFDPQNKTEYRRRFEEDQALLNRLRILEHNREEIVRRYEMVLLSVIGGVLLVAGGAHLINQGRRQRRIERLRDALVRLSAGREDVEVGVRGRDVLGRIAVMIEEISRVMARDRKRLAALQNLSMWQETARRHAHEMKTPLTAARLELTRLREMVPEGEGKQTVESLSEELDRLSRFTREFTSFARLPSPRLEVHDLGAVVAEFATTFARAWPTLELKLDPPESPLLARIDRELIRQALVNLCDNSAQAGARNVVLGLGESSQGVFLDVADDGPGIPPAIRGRVFDPYVTTRQVGEGMGLGLAISKKILLDHGGDLEVAETSEAGTVFRMVCPSPPAPLPSPPARPGEGRQESIQERPPYPAAISPSPGGRDGDGRGGQGGEGYS